MEQHGTTKAFISPMAVAFLALLLAVPTGSAWGRTSARSSAHPILSTIHKKAPTVEKTDRRQAIGKSHPKGQQPIQVVSLSNAKRKPRRHSSPSVHPISSRISAQSAFVMDAESGEEIFALSPDLPRQPASTIKVLTGLISIDDLENKDLVPVSRRAAGMPRSKVYLRRDTKYRADDLINAVLLSSANDASVALAERIGGSERAFAKLMTEKARQLGAMNTICKTASGLTAKGQQSTARDLAIIFNQAMKNDEFARRMRRTKVKTSEGKTLRSHNRALWQITGTEGGKTGYTWAARQTYVGKFKRGNRELLVSIMGSKDMWNDIKKLVEYGFANSGEATAVASAAGPSPPPSRGGQEQSSLVIISDNKKIAKL